MAFLHVPKVRLKGLSCCVPKTIESNKQYHGFVTPEEADKIIASIGVEQRRVSDSTICTSDLFYHAAEKLLIDLNWAKSDIDCLIVVTQTPDYLVPATSCLLQNRLGLKDEAFVMDISMGCSGWIYGLQVISSILSHGQLKKGLLMVGDTSTKFCSSEDKSTYLLFGDAGTVTALEYDESNSGFRFHTATDGSGYNAIIIPDGGYRNQTNFSSFEMVESKPGIKLNKLQVVLDGMNVFSFSISKAPETINLLSEKFGIDLQQVDYFIFHQANLFMNERIRRKLKLPPEKVPYSLKKYGNTSSASIPLTLITEIGKDLQNCKKNIIACGFGVGLSWGSVQFNTEDIICSEILSI